MPTATSRRASLLLITTVLVACSDAEDARKRAESDIIRDVSVPAGYELVADYEGGQGGGGPELVYRTNGEEPSIDSLGLPEGYEAVLLKPLPPYEEFVPGLDRFVVWGPMYYAGPVATPDGQGECAIVVTLAESSLLVSVSASCDVDGRLPPLRPGLVANTPVGDPSGG